MGVLRTALDNLAAVSVTGMTSYALEDTPDALTRAQLPALVILPELGGESPGLEANTFSAGDGQLTIEVAHVLLLEPVMLKALKNILIKKDLSPTFCPYLPNAGILDI